MEGEDHASDQEENSGSLGESDRIEAGSDEEGDEGEDEEEVEGNEEEDDEDGEGLEDEEGEYEDEEGQEEDDDGRSGEENDEEEQGERRGGLLKKRAPVVREKAPAAASPPLEFQRFALKKTGNRPTGDEGEGKDQPSPKAGDNAEAGSGRLEFQKFALKKTGIVPAVDLRAKPAPENEQQQQPAWLTNLKKTPRGGTASSSPTVPADTSPAGGGPQSNPWKKTTPRSDDPASPTGTTSTTTTQSPSQPGWMVNLRKGSAPTTLVAATAAAPSAAIPEGTNIPPWKKNVALNKPGESPKPGPTQQTTSASPLVSPSRWNPNPGGVATSPGWQPLSPKPAPWQVNQPGAQGAIGTGSPQVMQAASVGQTGTQLAAESGGAPSSKSGESEREEEGHSEMDSVPIMGTEDMMPFHPMDARNAYKFSRALAVLKVKFEQEQRLRKSAQQRLQWAHKALGRAVRDLEKARERLEGLEQHLGEERSEALITRIKEMELALVGEFGQDALSSDSDLDLPGQAKDPADKARRRKAKQQKANANKSRKNALLTDDKHPTKSGSPGEKHRSSKSSKHKSSSKTSSSSGAVRTKKES